MPAKLTGYEKVINKCIKVGWINYPEYTVDFDSEWNDDSYNITTRLKEYILNKRTLT